ncbi:MAG: YihY/virulence factor BrkB family protein [Opitutaceae bacterium]
MIQWRQRYDRTRHLFSQDIWEAAALSDRTARGRLYAAMRVAVMTWHGIVENSLFSRAGALSYSSMLGFPPLIAIVVMFSSIVLERTDPDFALNQLNRVIIFVAPQLRQIQEPAETPQRRTDEEAPTAEQTVPRDTPEAASARTSRAETAPGYPSGADPAAPEKSALTVNPELLGFLNSIIEASQSKAIGIIGAIALIVIVIQLFSSIENAFNDIWGVRRGRNWILRIVFYWTAVTLGAVLAFTSITLLSASTFVSTIESLPLGPELRRLFVIAAPLTAGVILAGLLTIFYRYIPNTSVGWWPSLTGGVTVVVLLYLNNILAFLYLNTVVRQQSLFGSFALPIILMLGLFVFWLFVLLGGQITYAVQNANYRSSNMAWHGLHYHARQGLSLLVLTLIARRFRSCKRAYSAPELSELIKIPTQILNACIGRLTSLRLISRIPPEDGPGTQEYRFQPARPLDAITLTQFKDLFDGLGEGPTREILDRFDPVVRRFHDRMKTAVNDALGDESLDELISELPEVDFPRPESENAKVAATGI